MQLAPGFEADLDAVIQEAIRGGCVHGVEVLARRGSEIYHRAFGYADVETARLMETDSIFRMYSMSKVLTSTVALMLYESGALSLTDAVGDFIPSFNRKWEVVEPAAGLCPKGAAIAALDPRRQATVESVSCYDMATGCEELRPFTRKPSSKPMLIKHLMSESSGIGYEFINPAHAIANALREKQHPTLYRSSCILGHRLNLEEFCDAIAAAGVLTCEPGTPSYGLGASVLGRVIEVAYERLHGKPRRLSEIFREMLFDPLGMTSSAAFFLPDGDPRTQRIPKLYGLRQVEGGEGRCVPAEQSVPLTTPPYSNHTDHYEGARAYESGDTGCLMTLADYAKFLDFLHDGGVSASGTRLLSIGGIHALTRARLAGIEPNAFLEPGASFNFGWVTLDASSVATDGYVPHTHPACNFWSGYAQTHVRFYRDDDAYLLIGVQVMDHAMTKLTQAALHEPLQHAFLGAWRQPARVAAPTRRWLAVSAGLAVAAAAVGSILLAVGASRRRG
jgi:CubicO group peptidase (beta-lactamase class C family)